jgi:hypothetical protein
LSSQRTTPPTFSRCRRSHRRRQPCVGHVRRHGKDRDDRSIVCLCDDRRATPRPIADPRQRPGHTWRSCLGSVLRVGVRPRHDISGRPRGVRDGGQPIARDTSRAPFDPPRAFVEAPTTTFVSGTWNVQGTWRTAADDQYVGGYGIFGTSADASLVYQHDQPVERMSIRVVLTPDKATGQSFAIPGSPADTHSGLNSDIYIKYDPRTKTGIRCAWRTTQSPRRSCSSSSGTSTACRRRSTRTRC